MHFIHAHSRVLTKTSLAAGIAFRLILPGMGSIFSVVLRSYQSGLFLKGLRFGILMLLAAFSDLLSERTLYR